jgi:succinate dehydrogenase/fumarate reductase flavoprotein subunit
MIPELRQEFWENVNVPGGADELNQTLEYAGRVADFLELAELMCRDALDREESCGGHFRTEYQTADGEALRNDDEYAYVAPGSTPARTPSPSCTRSRSSSRTSSWPRATGNRRGRRRTARRKLG